MHTPVNKSYVIRCEIPMAHNLYWTDEILVEVAKLLRRYHDIGEKYVHRLTGKEVWMLPKQFPVEVMFHSRLVNSIWFRNIIKPVLMHKR